MDMTNEQYYDLIRPYEDARRLLETRLEILNHSLYGSRAVCGPIHNMQNRIKAKKSIEDKLRRLGQRDSVSNARDYLQDIAGIRVICYFVDDIYNVAAGLKRQSDLVLVKERDYIATPKPVYCLDAMEYFPVEVQFRTMSMDFWASMEHRICYKKNPEHRERLEQEFLTYAAVLKEIEERFEEYRERRENGWPPEEAD